MMILADQPSGLERELTLQQMKDPLPLPNPGRELPLPYLSLPALSAQAILKLILILNHPVPRKRDAPDAVIFINLSK